MKKTVFAVLFLSMCSVLFLLNKGTKIHAFAAVGLNTRVEEVTAQTAGSALGTHIDSNDGCTYYKITFVISGNSSSTAFSAAGTIFEYNPSYFEAVDDINEHPYYERGIALADLSIMTTDNSAVGIVSVGITGSIANASDLNGDIYSFLLKTKTNVNWTNQSEIITNVTVDVWSNNNTPIPFTLQQSYTYQVSRIIGDLNDDGVVDVLDAQILDGILYSGIIHFQYTDDPSSYNAYVNLFSDCDIMIITVTGTTYVMLGIADVNADGYIDGDDIQDIMQYYINVLAQNNTNTYIGQPHDFTIIVSF